MTDSTLCSPDLLQLSLTIQQAYSQLNLLLSQQQQQQQQHHQHDRHKSSERQTDSNSSSNSNSDEDSSKIPSAICADHQARSCHYTSQPTFFKSASSVIPRCAHHRHPTQQQSRSPPPLSTSMSSSLLASSPIGCTHDSWYQNYHRHHYQYSHSHHALPHTETIQQYQCYNSTACHCQKHHHYQHCPITSINTFPGSIYAATATPPETTASSHCFLPQTQPPLPPPKTLASPAGSTHESRSTANSPVPPSSIHRNDLLSSKVDQDPLYLSPAIEKQKTGIHLRESLSPTQDAHTMNSDKKLKADQPSFPRGWWKSKWHRLRTRNKTSVLTQSD